MPDDKYDIDELLDELSQEYYSEIKQSPGNPFHAKRLLDVYEYVVDHYDRVSKEGDDPHPVVDILAQYDLEAAKASIEETKGTRVPYAPEYIYRSSDIPNITGGRYAEDISHVLDKIDDDRIYYETLYAIPYPDESLIYDINDFGDLIDMYSEKKSKYVGERGEELNVVEAALYNDDVDNERQFVAIYGAEPILNAGYEWVRYKTSDGHELEHIGDTTLPKPEIILEGEDFKDWVLNLKMEREFRDTDKLTSPRKDLTPPTGDYLPETEDIRDWLEQVEPKTPIPSDIKDSFLQHQSKTQTPIQKFRPKPITPRKDLMPPPSRRPQLPEDIQAMRDHADRLFGRRRRGSF